MVIFRSKLGLQFLFLKSYDEDLKFKVLFVIMQVAENLSMELTNVRGRIDQLTETNRSLEQSKKLALQQHELYEQEIRGLQDQLENSRQVSRSQESVVA